MDNQTTLGLDKILVAESTQRKLEITVVYTSVPLTLQALKTAGELACRLQANITVLVPQVVPYPLPLTSPPVLLEFNERRFRTIAEMSPVETRVQLYLCRDRIKAICGALKPHSLIVVGAHKSFWPTDEKWVARQLRKAGHEVIVSEKE